MDQASIRDLQELDRSFLLHLFTDHIELNKVGTRIVLEREGDSSEIVRAPNPRSAGRIVVRKDPATTRRMIPQSVSEQIARMIPAEIESHPAVAAGTCP